MLEVESPIASASRRFHGRTLMVTGGAGDIGSEVARALGKAGAAVALVDVRREAVMKTAETMAASGIRATAHGCDISSVEALQGCVAEIIAVHGSIDYLFNNAGYQGDFRPTHLYPFDDFRRVIEINLVGAFNVLRTVAEHMVANRFGRIVNTASGAGLKGPPNMIAYGASKAAIIALTATAAKDLAPHNIRVNAISPALIGPGMMWERQVRMQSEAGSQYFSADPHAVEQQMLNSIPMRRLGTVREIADAVVYLLSDESSYITGINLPIAGGVL